LILDSIELNVIARLDTLIATFDTFLLSLKDKICHPGGGEFGVYVGGGKGHANGGDCPHSSLAGTSLHLSSGGRVVSSYKNPSRMFFAKSFCVFVRESDLVHVDVT
jgi:hypothetical protein